MAAHNLDKILRPRGIAIVGAGSQDDHVSYRVLNNLLTAGFEGAILPVHPHEATIQGVQTYSTVADLPESVDLVVVCSPAESVPELVFQCGQRGIKGIVIISAGFRETGPAGHVLEQDVHREAARFPGLRVLGPNCLGIVVPHLKLNASIASVMPKPGRVAFVSQSGTLCMSALDWALQEGIGFSHFVSIGNMLEVGVGDLIDYFADDPYTDSIVLYVESITQARHFMSAARAITRTKPIVVYKAGRFSESAAAAVLHTGSMSGVDAVYEAAFQRAGIVRVSEIDDMFDCARLLARISEPTGPRLAIVTNAGGPGVVATDSLIARKGELARLSTETIGSLDDFLPTHWSQANPIDILGDAGPDLFARTIEVVLKDDAVDAVLVILTPQSVTDPTGTAQAVADIAARTRKPILTAWMGGGAVREGIELLNRVGVPSYSTPKNAVHAFMHLVSYARNRETLYETPLEVPTSFPLDRKNPEEIFRAAKAGKCEFLSEQVSKQLLEAYGIATSQPRLAASPEEAVRLSNDIGFPVAMKIVSPQITHKNEVGGVALNVASDDDVRRVFDRIVQSVRQGCPDADIEGVSVQPMALAPDGFEMILGSRKDAAFGAVILIGAGGVAAEVLQDFSLGLPPLNERLARRMLESLRSWPILAGHQRRRPINLPLLIETLIRFSSLVAETPQLAEMDVNPLLVTPERVIALDAGVRLDRSFVNGAPRYSHLAIRPYPEHLTCRTKLRDGTSVTLRPIKPEDEPLWHQMLAECSPASIRFRFRSMFQQMTHEMATRFCFMDYDRELAMVAEVVGDQARKLVGVGHLICNAEHTDAEFAVLVPDQWQRQGIGSLIIETCLAIAIDWHLGAVVGATDHLNSGMIATFKHAGFELDYGKDPDVVIARKQLQGMSIEGLQKGQTRDDASL